MEGTNGNKPPPPPPHQGRGTPPTPPHSNNGRMCRLGQVVGAIILAYLLAAVIGIVTA